MQLSTATIAEEPTESNGLTPLLSAKEVARLLGLSSFAVYQAARLPVDDPEHLASVRFGSRVLFDAADIRNYIAAHKAAA